MFNINKFKILNEWFILSRNTIITLIYFLRGKDGNQEKMRCSWQSRITPECFICYAWKKKSLLDNIPRYVIANIISHGIIVISFKAYIITISLLRYIIISANVGFPLFSHRKSTPMWLHWRWEKIRSLLYIIFFLTCSVTALRTCWSTSWRACSNKSIPVVCLFFKVRHLFN